MPKKKGPEDDPKKQFKRFVETARELEIKDSDQPLDKAFKRLTAKPKEPSGSQSG